MIDFKLNLPRGRAPRLLFIGAHSDDIEIGCGATVLALMRQYPRAQVDWVVLTAGGQRIQEAQQSAAAFLRGAARPRILLQSFRESYFPSEAVAIKEFFESLKTTVAPDLIFTHHKEDLHQDHRIVSELTWNSFRNHCILEYEIPKYDGGLGSPSVFMPAAKSIAQKKSDLLMKHFGSQRSKHWFSEETFKGLMRLRGIECASPSGYAEAFYGRKFVLVGSQ